MARLGTAFAMVFVALLAVLPAGTAPVSASPSDTEPASPPTTVERPDDERERPVPTVSEFYPESNNLSDCLGLVERPGCGSEARGGWRQTATFLALAAGLGVIFWRVSVGVRRNRERSDA